VDRWWNGGVVQPVFVVVLVLLHSAEAYLVSVFLFISSIFIYVLHILLLLFCFFPLGFFSFFLFYFFLLPFPFPVLPCFLSFLFCLYFLFFSLLSLPSQTVPCFLLFILSVLFSCLLLLSFFVLYYAFSSLKTPKHSFLFPSVFSFPLVLKISLSPLLFQYHLCSAPFPSSFSLFPPPSLFVSSLYTPPLFFLFLSPPLTLSLPWYL